jgi:CRISPR system Cascade subunit CasE
MYLSRMVLNPRNARARRDIGNPYEMHSTLARLFDDPKGARPLWRLEGRRPPVVLLQSAAPPDFARLADRDGYRDYLAAEPETKPYPPAGLVRAGARLRFRLEANPTVSRDGKRHGLRRVEDQLRWLGRQAEKCGFSIVEADVSLVDRRRFAKRGSDTPIVLLAVRFDGLLSVTSPDRLREAVRAGIGHGKAMGLGLLSLAPG